MNIKHWLMSNFDNDKAAAIRVLTDGIAHFDAIAKSKHSSADEKISAIAKLAETKEYMTAVKAL